MTIRPADPRRDAAACAAIYAPSVESTPISFETVPPDPAEFRARMEKYSATHPYLVAEEDGQVIGYAYASTYRAREAYRFTCEDSIYLAPDAVGHGLGGKLLGRLIEDSSKGDHDTIMAACDSERYILLGVKEYHDNCTDNLFAAMQGLGLTPPECPSPLNLFMNIPWTPGGGLSFDPPTTKPGDYVTLRAELDCIVAMSACPQDILPINGKTGQTTEAHFQIVNR